MHRTIAFLFATLITTSTTVAETPPEPAYETPFNPRTLGWGIGAGLLAYDAVLITAFATTDSPPAFAAAFMLGTAAAAGAGAGTALLAHNFDWSPGVGHMVGSGLMATHLSLPMFAVLAKNSDGGFFDSPAVLIGGALYGAGLGLLNFNRPEHALLGEIIGPVVFLGVLLGGEIFAALATGGGERFDNAQGPILVSTSVLSLIAMGIPALVGR